MKAGQVVVLRRPRQPWLVCTYGGPIRHRRADYVHDPHGKLIAVARETLLPQRQLAAV